MSPEVRQIIRRKVSSYLGCYLSIAASPSTSKQVAGQLKKSKAPPSREFPPLHSLKQLLSEQDTYHHLYK